MIPLTRLIHRLIQLITRIVIAGAATFFRCSFLKAISSEAADDVPDEEPRGAVPIASSEMDSYLLFVESVFRFFAWHCSQGGPDGREQRP